MQPSKRDARKLGGNFVDNEKDKTKIRSLPLAKKATGNAIQGGLNGADPHSKIIGYDSSAESLIEQERQFQENKNAEIEELEALLASMREYHLPEKDIKDLMGQIAELETARFEDTLNEQQSNLGNHLATEEKIVKRWLIHCFRMKIKAWK